ncbi:hypothetical protein GOV11_04830 [Candidatus Woesearchaeota archaeon]|nr:hypothetical protein [Candidatus Woesearchaeota archaeon]
MNLAFEYSLSKAIDIRVSKDTLGTAILTLEFKYVRFVLKLDDKDKFEQMVCALTGKPIKKNNVKVDKVNLPKMYKK